LTSRPLDKLSPQAIDRLQRFVQMLSRWRKITNLTSLQNFSQIWERDIHDSLFVQQVCPAATRWLDLGSGAGFPGIVIAVAIAERPGAEVHCVESDARKCAFLRAVVTELNIPAKVHHLRAETLSTVATGQIDAVTARAFASVDNILAFVANHLSSGAVAVLPRGAKSLQEVESIDTNRYTVNVNPNPGHAGGLIVVVRQKVKFANGRSS
jgi:16S rRNA (guanine527-N7)-methyltransferase